MTTALRVLLVEDREEDAHLLLSYLGQHGLEITSVRVQTAAAMHQALESSAWDVVLSDYSMPAFSASEALETLHASGLDLPFIIVSGTVGEETAVTSLKAGAHDFLPKDRLGRLVPAIEREVREAAERRKLRAAEIALSETRQHMQFAMDAAGVGTWQADIATGQAVWSDLLERMHGVPEGQFAGTIDAFVDTVHPADRDRIRTLILRFLREGSDFKLEYRTLWPDDSIHWIVSFGRSLPNDSGAPTRAGGIAVDVTHQKHLEEQLQQAQKMESIGNLAGGIAHDFNNLLTVMTGCCQFLLERYKDDPSASDDIGQIRRAADSATALTRQLLAFSRRQILAPRVLSLNDILAALQKMLRRLIEAHVQIDLQLAPDLPLVSVDPGQMEQVVLNLAVNARDAMPAGGVLTIETGTVELDAAYARTHVDVRPGSYVVLSITDTGSGIPPEVLPQVFEPFFTTKPLGQGTGLGLATVYGIVKQSGGHLAVWSEVGMGTTFRIYLPVATTDHPSPDVHAPAVTDVLEGTETVLVVEDDPRLRALDRRILQRYGYTVLLASSAAEAQRLCTEHAGTIHVVLTDLVMPGGSGRTVGEWIAQHRRTTKVVYMSGYSSSSIIDGALLEPGTTYLQKPFTPEALARTVRQVLS